VINNGKFQTLLKVVLWLTPIIIGFALALGAYREKLEAVKERAAAIQIRVENVENRMTSAEVAVGKLDRDIVYIKEALTRIEKKIDEKNK
jgi:hypothetical protein